MPVHPTFPGIYIEEVPSSTHTITAAPTSITVFVGYTHPFRTKRPGKPIELFSFSDYERWFGGFFRGKVFDDEANAFGDVAQAVNQFFLNGGADAFVVGLPVKALTAGTATIGPLKFTALQITDPDYQMDVTVSNAPSSFSFPPGSPPDDDRADVTISYFPPSSSKMAGLGSMVETYRQVSLFPGTHEKPNPNYIGTRIGTKDNPVSALVTVEIDSPPGPLQNGTQKFTGTQGTGPIFTAKDFTDVFQQDTPLDKLPIFNLLVIPGVFNNEVLSAAQVFCERKRAFLIMDPPLKDSADGSIPGFDTLIQLTMEGTTFPKSTNAALYFPYLTTNDPITGLAADPRTTPPGPFEIPPSGTIAGVYASTDLTRGVWKAPAGLATTLRNVIGVVERGQMTDQRQGTLNPIGVNCIRTFPGIGSVVWGARTSITENPSLQQWKYVPVRRIALFLEQTLYSSLGWVVFEPNDEPLWAAIRTTIESFMLGLFRQGAFQGATPSQAFQVKCDSQTTTQDDINNGIVNIIVAFAPLKPAEFVVIKIAQLAGQTQT